MEELIRRQDAINVVKRPYMHDSERVAAMQELPVISPERAAGIELKPCPFCGGKAIFKASSNSSSHHGAGFNFKIECGDCGAKLPKNYETEFCLTEGGILKQTNDERGKAANEWNKRYGEKKENEW